MKMFSSYPGCYEVQSAPAEFSRVLIREGYGGTIYSGIKREASHILYGLILLMQGLFYSLLTSFF